MKKIQLRSLSFLFIIPLFFGGKNELQAQSGDQGLLWEISGNGIKKSYLYGTIHIPDQRVFTFDKLVEKKLLSCKAFAMELVIDEIDQMELMTQMMMPTNSLDKLLTEEEYAKVAALMKKKMGMDLALMNKMKPFMVYTQLMQDKMPSNGEQPLDMYLLSTAREKGMKVMAVEKLQEQLAAINSISLEDQAKMLVQLTTDTVSDANNFESLIASYLSQDLDKMAALVDDPTLPKEMSEQFLVVRNKVMAERIEGFMKEQSTFTAVGAAHLGGKDGVIALLRKAGFEVKAIPFAFKN